MSESKMAQVDLVDMGIPEELGEEVMKHVETYDKILSIYIRKNMDYGQSFDKIYNEFGMLSTVIRLSDKINRLKTLANQENLVMDESIEDTLLDIANYCIMTIVAERKKED